MEEKGKVRNFQLLTFVDPSSEVAESNKISIKVYLTPLILLGCICLKIAGTLTEMVCETKGFIIAYLKKSIGKRVTVI